MYKVYVVENNLKRLVATFEDLYDAREYVEFMENKYKDDTRKLIIREA